MKVFVSKLVAFAEHVDEGQQTGSNPVEDLIVWNTAWCNYTRGPFPCADLGMGARNFTFQLVYYFLYYCSEGNLQREVKDRKSGGRGDPIGGD